MHNSPAQRVAKPSRNPKPATNCVQTDSGAINSGTANLKRRRKRANSSMRSALSMLSQTPWIKNAAVTSRNSSSATSVPAANRGSVIQSTERGLAIVVAFLNLDRVRR